MTNTQSIKVVLLGFGTIGGSVGRIISEDGALRRVSLQQNPHSVSSIADVLARIEVVAIVTLETDEVRAKISADARYAGLRNALITANYNEALDLRPDIVVELIGGINPAFQFITKALERGANVVTANKAVLAAHGKELRAYATAQNLQLLYEASVGGAVPIVRAIRHSLMGDKVVSIVGVLNGTTNFILDKMTSEGAEYADALREAQDLGFAEADPSADVDGYDAAAKISILASLAFGRDFTAADVDTSGIASITQGMIIAAKTNGQVYKLVAKALRDGCPSSSDNPNENITLSVAPELVPEKSAFGELQGSMNAVEVVSEYSGKLTFFGHGAGGDPTASAVLADIIEIAQGF
jgi:homoserine dehydrogenase